MPVGLCTWGTNTLLVMESRKLGTNLPSRHGGRAYEGNLNSCDKFMKKDDIHCI